MSKLEQVLKVKREDTSLVIRIYYAFFCSGLMINVIGSILPYLGLEYNFSYDFRGLLSSIYQIGNLVAVYIAGFLPLLIGRKNSTSIMLILLLVGITLTITTELSSVMLIAFLLLGLGRGTLSTITNVVIGEKAGNKVAGLNVLHAMFSLGAVLAPILVYFLSPKNWKLPMVIIAILIFISLALILTSSLDNKKGTKEKSGEKFPKSLNFWINTFIMFFYLCVEQALLTWLVTYFKDTGILSPSLSQLMSSLLWIMVLTGRIICATISTKIDKNKLILTLGLCLTIFSFLLLFSTKLPVIIIGLLGVGISMSGIYPTTLSTMEEKYSKSTVSIGTCIACASIGSIVMPYFIGIVAEKNGIKFGMITIIGALSVMLLLMIIKLVYSNRLTRTT